MAKEFCELMQSSWLAAAFVGLILIFFIALCILLFLDWQFHVALRKRERERNHKIYRRAVKAGVE